MIFSKSTIVSIKVALLKTKQIFQDHYNKALQLLPLYFLFESQTNYSNAQTYYILVFVISNLVFFYNQSFHTKVIDKSIIFHMLKPIKNYPNYRFGIDLISNMYSFFIAILEITILTKLFNLKFAFNDLNLSVYFLLILYLILGTIIGYLLYISASQIALWIKNIDIQNFLLYQVLLFCSGFYIPIEHTPKIFQKIILITPFPYLFHYPINIILKNEFNYVNTMAVGLLWIIILYFISQIMWKKGSDQFYD